MSMTVCKEKQLGNEGYKLYEEVSHGNNAVETSNYYLKNKFLFFI